MKKSRVLAEGAVITAVYAVLLLITIYVPLLSMITILVLTVPFTLFIIRHGLKSSYAFLGVSVILTLLIGGLYALPLIIATGSVGVVLGILYRKKKSFFAILLGGSLTYLINFVLFYIFSIVFFQLDPMDIVKDSFDQSLNMTEQLYQYMGQDPSKEIKRIEETLQIIVYLIPTALVIGSCLFAAVTQLITSAVLKRFKYDVAVWVPFREWMLPKSFLWYYLGTIILMMTNPKVGSGLFIAVWNLFYILEFTLLIQGISFIFYFFWKKGKPKTVPILITIFSFLIPILLYPVRFLGIIDLGFDLRKRMKP